MRSSLLGLLVVVACSGDGDGTTKDTDDSSVVSDVVVSDLVLEPYPTMGTVIRASWTTDTAVSGFVRFTVDGVTRETAPVADTTAHEHLLVGVAPGATVDVELVHDLDGTEWVQQEQVTAGSLPGTPPSLTVTGTSDRFLALPILDEGANTSTLAVVDPQGRVVWMYEDPTGLSVFRAHVALDGTGIVYAATIQNGQPNQNSKMIYVGWDGQVIREAPVPYLAHDFVERSDGSIVTLSYESREDPTLGTVQGNKLVELDAEGAVVGTLWSAWDCYDPNVEESIDLDHGWIHANALDYDEDAGLLFVGMRNLGTIAAVSEADGSCQWGFEGSAATIDASGTSFLHQHQFDIAGDRFLVFDNDGAAGFVSRVLEFAFDPDAGTATLEREIDLGKYSFILGDVHRLDDGDTLVTWSVPDTVDRIGPDDEIVWSVTADNDDLIFGFTEVMLDPGRPDLGVLH